MIGVYVYNISESNMRVPISDRCVSLSVRHDNESHLQADKLTLYLTLFAED